MSYKVVIVDDHSLLAQAIRDMVNSFQEFSCEMTCSNGDELLKKMKNPALHPDVILMDVQMPVLNGIEATKELTKLYPHIKVLALSMEAEEQKIIAMLKAGAKGYLLKDTKKEILEKALIETVEFGFYHTNNVTEILMNQLKNPDSGNHFDLTDRELEFLHHACSEMTYKEIAEKMFLSPKTVDNYRDAVFTKLNVKNRIGMVLFAMKHSLVEIE